MVLIAGGSGITPFMSILNEISSKNGTTNWHPTNIQLIYCAKQVQDISMLTPILPILHEPTTELTNFKLKIFVTQEQGIPISAFEILNKPPRVIKMLTSTKNRSSVGITQEGFIWRAIIAALTFVVFLMSLVFLSDIFIHQVQGKSSRKSNPSWINDLLVFAAFVIAMSCSAVATVTFNRRKFSDNRESKIPRKVTKETKNKNGLLFEPQIYFGKRPNLSGNIIFFLFPIPLLRNLVIHLHKYENISCSPNWYQKQ